MPNKTTNNQLQELLAKSIETTLNSAGAQLILKVRIKGKVCPKVSLDISVETSNGTPIALLEGASNLQNGDTYAVVDLPNIFKVELR